LNDEVNPSQFETTLSALHPIFANRWLAVTYPTAAVNVSVREMFSFQLIGYRLWIVIGPAIEFDFPSRKSDCR